jgi:hypothetical protein
MPTTKRQTGFWRSTYCAVRVGAVLRVSGRLRVAVHDPLGPEDRRRTPQVDAPNQLG